MNVLSLFDGMSCGMIAMMLSAVEVDKYVAYEIDKYAIDVSKHNFPQIEQRGDVFNADFREFEGFDFLVGGSPCTYWSIAQTKNRETEASGMGWDLFSQYTRALREAKPKYFIYENNKSMSAEIRRCISEAFGFEPICINSALVSAQNRQRLYWVGIKQSDGSYKKCNVEQPEDRGILLKDILETKHVNIPSYPVNEAEGGKSHTLKAQYYKNGVANFVTNGGFDASAVAELVNIPNCGTLDVPVYQVKDGKITVKGKEYPIKLIDGCYIIRKLTVRECMRLQTVPEWYDFSAISNSQAYKCLGNGWTCEVISHLINRIMNEVNIKNTEVKDMELKVNEYQLPEKILFNYEDLKAELTEKVNVYTSLVYTDETIKDAKEDRANLNKLKKALNDERIRREKEYLVPFNEFKAKVNEIIAIIDKPIEVIDKQIKEFENAQKQNKLAEITKFFNETEHPEWLFVYMIQNEKWGNATTSMKSIQEEITSRIEQINKDLVTLSNLPEFGFEATEAYKSSLDINKAISEAMRMAEVQKKKEEAKKEAEFVPPVIDEKFQNEPFADAAKMNPPVERQWVKFQANLSRSEALALRAFFDNNKIEFKAVNDAVVEKMEAKTFMKG